MDKKTAISLAGSCTALAKILSISVCAISQWGEKVPDQRVWQLRVLRPMWFNAPSTPASTDEIGQGEK